MHGHSIPEHPQGAMAQKKLDDIKPQARRNPPISALKDFFHRYIDFSGETSRADYWWSQLFILLTVSIPLALGTFFMATSYQGQDLFPGAQLTGVIVTILFTLYALSIATPTLAIFIRRLSNVTISQGLHTVTYIIAGILALTAFLPSLILLTGQVINTIPNASDGDLITAMPAFWAAMIVAFSPLIAALTAFTTARSGNIPKLMVYDTRKSTQGCIPPTPAPFLDALKSFFAGYMDTRNLTNRGDYWRVTGFLFVTLPGATLISFVCALSALNAGPDLMLLALPLFSAAGIWGGITLIPYCSMTIRRLMDAGVSRKIALAMVRTFTAAVLVFAVLTALIAASSLLLAIPIFVLLAPSSGVLMGYWTMRRASIR